MGPTCVVRPSTFTKQSVEQQELSVLQNASDSLQEVLWGVADALQEYLDAWRDEAGEDRGRRVA
ncbi:MAG: hypothetical protein O2816_14145 [Planctomycetota bacterium]|nr:hypothetical protein [Planctomycetota bacterium]